MVRIEKFNENDFMDYYKLVGNEKVMQMITERSIPINEAVKNFKLILKNNNIHKSFGSFKVLDIQTNKFLGSALLKIKNFDSKEAEIGYMLLPENWGKGIGSKIAEILIKLARQEPQLERLRAIIDPNNKASKRILENNDFVSVKLCEIDGLPGEVLELKLK